MADAKQDVLVSMLTELRALRESHARMEQKLAALDIASPELRPSVPTSPSSSSLAGLAQPVPINRIPELPTDSLALSSSPLTPPTVPTFVRRTVSGRKSFTDDAEKERFAAWQRSGASTPLTQPKSKDLYPNRVILTTYPGQVGIAPIPLSWGADSADKRGPILASRQPNSLKLRNAIGAYSGGYSIYRALGVASGQVDANHRPDYKNTEPAFDISPNPAWYDPKKIVSMDPFGHIAQVLFKSQIDSGIDIKPTISCTKAHLKSFELDDAVEKGTLKVDGKILMQTPSQWVGTSKAGVEVAVSKCAVDPVWHLPGVAERFGISETTLRRALFEETGGSFPELITRSDLDVFLPPIGGLTVYIFGNPAYLSDESKTLALRVHDECNGSDVFGSDICTCRPYLLYGIEEAVKAAQNGGVGCVVYFRKEGRALGEVLKYLVYNARKRAEGGDSASNYFLRTENIAGVKDSRFQALMPDVLLWLGIKKIDHLLSMSDMKYDAITGAGIKVLNRHDLPDEFMPPDSRVEIDAKIAAGYFSSTKVVQDIDLAATVGRGWEDIAH